MWCWGLNYDGEVGVGNTAAHYKPVQVAGTWTSISGLGGDTFCGIKSDQSGWCWGRNYNGAVGDGTRTSRSVPMPHVG